MPAAIEEEVRTGPAEINNEIKAKTETPDETVFHLREQRELYRVSRRYRLIDLFAGAGGMTLGFTEAMGHAFVPMWANDFNGYACDTYRANFGNHCACGDILEILENPHTEIPPADVVIGGPPCQGFSLLNKNRRADIRKELWRPFMDVVERSEASVFVMENVPQLSVHSNMERSLGRPKRWASDLRGQSYVPPTMASPKHVGRLLRIQSHNRV